MNLRTANQLSMVGACITVAQSPDYKPVWLGKEPADFGTDLTKLQADYGAITAKAAQADAATGGAGDAKSVAEGVLEDAAFVLARALANHFKKTGDLDRLGKVDVSKSEIMKLRTQELVNQTTAIRDLGTAAVSEAGAVGRGVTAARVAALTAAITSFSNVMSTPRGQIVNRSALLKEVETDTAALVEHVGDMDDLVLQFDGGEPGIRFKEAWKRARIIVDTGGGHATAPTPPIHPHRRHRRIRNGCVRPSAHADGGQRTAGPTQNQPRCLNERRGFCFATPGNEKRLEGVSLPIRPPFIGESAFNLLRSGCGN